MQHTEYTVTGMDCPDCARTLERGLAQLDGVSECSVQFSAGRVQLRYDPAVLGADALISRAKNLGYTLSTPDANAQAALPAAQHAPTNAALAFLHFLLSERGGQILALSLTLFVLGLLAGWRGWEQLATLLHMVVIALAGLPQASTAIKRLFFARQVTIGLLMSVAAIGALLIGEPAEGAAVLVLFALGEALEGFSMQRARDSLHGLMQLAPDQAIVLAPCMDCAEHLGQDGYTGGACPWCGTHPQQRPASSIQVGETVLLRPGDRLALDGTIRSGQSLISQQHITGESAPLLRGPGDHIYAGSMNGDGTLEVLVTHASGDTLLRRIAALVEQAQSQRAPIERFIDRFAARYTPAVMLLAVLFATIPTLFFGQPFWDSADGQHGWLYRALSLLVVACPCALVISTPASVVSAMAAAMRAGVLVKGGAVLEELRRVRVMAFDKTGTLTHGKPQVLEVACADPGCSPATCAHRDEVLALAAAVEQRNTHPLAGAVVRAAEARQLNRRYQDIEQVTALPGRGAWGMVDGHKVTVGSHALFDADHSHGPELCAAVQAAEARGQTVMLVCDCDGDGVRGFITLADAMRPESAQTVQALRAAGIERTVMLTGDNAVVGENIARAAGIDEVHCGLLPDQKLGLVQELGQRYGPVAMVGDGVNDTPALAAASVGIAMGAAGSAQALETADIALMDDDLRRLPFLLKLSHKLAATVRWNIGLSMATKLAFLVLALFGMTSLWLAVLADSGIALLVILNGMRLLQVKDEDG